MPPKSYTPKKKPQIWQKCNCCEAYLVTDDSAKHFASDCPIDESGTFRDKPNQCPFISGLIFHSTRLDRKPVIDALDRQSRKSSLNGFLFLSVDVMEICQFRLGEHVTVRSEACDRPIVKSVWPIDSEYKSTVYVSDEDFYHIWEEKSDIRLIIKSLPFSDIQPADQIDCTTVDGEPIVGHYKIEICRFMQVYFRDRIFCSGNSIVFDFFNKTYRLLIKKITRTDFSDSLLDLEERIGRLEIDKPTESPVQFYLVQPKTKFHILDVTTCSGNDDSVNKEIEPLDLIGGLDQIINEIQNALEIAFGQKQSIAGFQIPRTALLYGISGCGKTLLANSFANSWKSIEIIRVNASDIFSKYFGETESNLSEYFSRSYRSYPRPTLIIIEEVTTLCMKEGKEETARRITGSFLNHLDQLHRRKDAVRTFLIATTNSIDNVHPSARRCGRFDLEIEIPVPSEQDRMIILRNHLRTIKHTINDKDVMLLGEKTHGFVGADISSLISKAAIHSIHRFGSREGGEPLVELPDILYAFNHVKPTAMREVLIECPNVRWEDIGGQQEIKLKLKQSIEWPLTNPESFSKFGIEPPKGILMYGPPGCSKTMIAKALATESRLNFLSIKGPELFSMWVGESERAIRDLFRKARQVAPAIIFFDEIDAIGGERTATGSGQSVKERVLTQLLTELDGVTTLNHVIIVAATNRPDLIDRALLRPGRIDRLIYVGLPDHQTRTDIFKIKFKQMPIDDEVSLETLVENTGGYSGAECKAICQEAALKALEENLEAHTVFTRHFDAALNIVKPRTSGDMLKMYKEYSLKN